MCRLHRPLAWALRSVLVVDARKLPLTAAYHDKLATGTGNWSEDKHAHHELSLFFLTLLSSRALSLSLTVVGWCWLGVGAGAAYLLLYPTQHPFQHGNKEPTLPPMLIFAVQIGILQTASPLTQDTPAFPIILAISEYSSSRR
jgi:hypothetical protein